MVTKGAEYHGYSLNAVAGNKHRQEMDEDGNNPSLPLFSYYECHVSNSITHVYISQNISEPAVYVPLVQFFNSRQHGDVVHLHLNCYGGRLDAGIQIVTSILNSQAQVIAHLDGVAYSMAAVMFLACDGHYVSPYGKLMLHTYSGGGGGGKAPDQREAQAAIDETYAKIVGYRKYKPPFCSSSEVSYLKFPHSFTAQAPILTAGPA
ncbi:ATP-dependent Clp protease proteolytic subunit [Providencia rettgeri]|uniref:ATP-dependent Clp protease proteolytic subunit n=1 Tax=Providencia rettgeri TaxID=587 RepID=UPI00068C7AF4|nr:ATP-dependent Clp protease proteolytic subunit [Providencia rettgeri]